MIVTALIQEINQLEAQIIAAQKRLAQLRTVEIEASNALQALKKALTVISEAAPGAIEQLKEAALSLFPVVPAIATTPQATEELNYSQDKDVEEPVEDGDRYDDPALVQPQPEPEVQRITHTSPHGTYEVIKVSETVSYCRNNSKGYIQCAYAGFNNKQRAEQWGKWLISKGVAQGFECRQSKRLENFKYELKLWGISLKTINKLATKNLGSSPKDEQQPPITPEQAKADLGFEQEYKPGDWVRFDGESLMISEVYENGDLSLESSTGTMIAHKSEVELAFRKPSSWQPFNVA